MAAKKPAPKPAPSKVPQYQPGNPLSFIFPKEDQAAAKAASEWYGQNSTPAFEAGNMYNYQQPTAATDPVLQRLQQDALAPENQRDPAMQASLDMLRNQAQRTSFVTPELMGAYNQARDLAMGVSSPAANAQRDQLNFGLNSALQTAMNNSQIGALFRGQMGGVQANLQMPAIRDYQQNFRQGLVGQQLGNLDRYGSLAGEVNTSQNQGQQQALGAYNSALGGQQSFEAQRAQQRMQQYQTANQQGINNYYQFGEADRLRREAYLAGHINAPYTGAAAMETGLGREAADANAKAQIAALKGSGGSSSSGSSSGTRSPSFGTSTPNNETFPNPQ